MKSCQRATTMISVNGNLDHRLKLFVMMNTTFIFLQCRLCASMENTPSGKCEIYKKKKKIQEKEKKEEFVKLIMAERKEHE